MKLKQSIPAAVLMTICATLFSPVSANSAAIQANSTCELGTCATPDAITTGQTVGPSTVNFTYTFLNGDKFSVTGSYGAAFPGGTSIFFTPTVTYTGASPSLGSDVLNLDMFQNYSFPGATSWDGTYNENFPLTLTSNAATGSTVAGQLKYDGQSVGMVGPFGPGTYNVSKSAALTGLTGSVLSADLGFVFTFAAGSVNGVTASSPSVPEPTQTFTLGLGLLAAAYAGIRLKKRA